MSYSKFKFICGIQKWMDSMAGQTFMNYAYSWGAAVVILGTLFKLTHLPGANLMLFIGMGTEVLVFFISAFDRPFVRNGKDNAENNDRIATCAPGYHALDSLSSRIETLERMKNMLPDGREAEEIHRILISIHQSYQQQYLKLSSQLTSIDNMDEQLKIQNTYLTEINKVYRRMLEAVGGKAVYNEK